MMQATSIGVDTLRLRPLDWQVAPDSALQVQPAAFNAGTGESAGDCDLFNGVRGVKAYLNRPLWQLTVKNLRGSPFAFVEMSVPKVASEGAANFAPVDAAGMLKAYATVENELRGEGFKCNLQAAALSRVDVFRNVAAGQPFSTYAPLLAMMRGSRMSSKQFGSTFLWGNKANALTAYDKREEMRQAGRDTAGLPENAVRFEYRLMQGAKVRAALPEMQTAALLASGIEVLGELYRGAWGRLAFGLQVGEIELLAQEQIREEMRGYRAAFGVRWVAFHLRDMGALQVARTIGADRYGELVKSIEGDSAGISKGERKAAALSRLRAVVNSIGPVHRNTIERRGARDVAEKRMQATERKARRAVALVRDRARLLDLGRAAGKGVTLATLYRELQSKVIGYD